ncbi:MAG: pilus assembly protein CpaB [Actinomycetota bacterium]|nr:pilus assembly protein CpaB [Actinomycetota bacterium]
MRGSVRLARSPVAYWLVVAVLALLTGMVAARVMGNAGALAARYGPLRPVVVAMRPLEAGTVVTAADLAVRRLPASVLPPGAVGSPDDAAGRTVVAPVFPDVPMVAAQLAPEGRRGLTALLPPGSRAVAVPNGRPSLALVRGDAVDVLATFDNLADQAEGSPPTFRVATDALVVDVGDESAAVAVSPEEAPRVAFALASGVVTLALASPSDLSGSSSPAGPAPPAPPSPGR